MSIESAKALIERIRTDEELAKKLAQAEDKVERVRVAREAGYHFTLPEMAAAKGELEDEELDAAGGSWCITDGHCGRTCENECSSGDPMCVNCDGGG